LAANVIGAAPRAAADPVAAKQTYLVGERGPELFSPGTSGSIVPNHQLGGGVTIQLTYAPQYSTASPAEAQRFAKAIIPELTRGIRKQGILLDPRRMS
jgi:phage-related minor tail protein